VTLVRARGRHPTARRYRPWLLALLLSWPACLQRPVDNPNILVISMSSGPNNLDPRVGADSFSEKVWQLMFDNLMELDDHLRLSPGLGERLDQPDPTTYVVTLRRGVKFHDGHELTSADVVYTFRSFLDPDFVSVKKGGYREVQSVDARDRYTVVFTLKQPFSSFPINLRQPIVPAGAGPEIRDHPIGTGPYRFVQYSVDDSLEVTAFEDYFAGRPKNDGVIYKITPDDIMRGLELKKGTVDIAVNELAPDVVQQLKAVGNLQTMEAPGVDYQYVGLNLRDPILRDVRVRQALAYAIDRRAIVEYLRRGLATPADTLLPPVSWAHAPDVFSFSYDPVRAKALLDAAGHPDPDGDGPATRFSLTLKVSNVEYTRLQSAVIQQDLQRVGVGVDIRSYEFATLYADVIVGNFQAFTLQWAQGALADPDILRRVFHSSQTPPVGFNRGYYRNPKVDALLDEASVASDNDRRRELFVEVQRIVAEEVPYISLWHIRNVIVAQRTLTGLRLSPIADFSFLRDVARGRD
jgi:peptide/nickel transport system substrate-binding protein